MPGPRSHLVMVAAAALVLAGACGVALLRDAVAGYPALLAWSGLGTAGWLIGWRAAARSPGIPFAGVLVVAAIARLALLLPEAPASDDLYRYIWDGRVANAGVNPFAWAPASDELAALRDDVVWPRINHPEIPTIYPPFAQVCFRAMAAVSTDPRGPRVLAALADLAASLLLARLLKRRGRAPGLAVAHAWCPLAMLESARGGHVDAVGAALLVGGLLAWQTPRAGRAALAGLLLGLSLLVKPVAAVLAPVLAVARGGRRAALLAGAAAAMLLWVPYLDAGERLATGFRAYAEHWEFNDALYSPLVAAGLGPRAARLVLGVVLALLVLAAPRVLRDPVGAAAPLVFALLAFSPTVHPWYGTWVAALLPLAPRGWQAGLAIWCALLPVSYFTAWREAMTGVWFEPVWPRVLLWGVTLLALVAGWRRERAGLSA